MADTPPQPRSFSESAIGRDRLDGGLSETSRWLTFAVPGLSAAVYPLFLDQFHRSLGPLGGVNVLAVLALLPAFLVPFAAIIAAHRLGKVRHPDMGQIRARRIAIFATAAPTLYVFMGVLLYMAGGPVPDEWVWLIFWLALTAYALSGLGRREQPGRRDERPVSPGLRVAHGISAAAILIVFLVMHIVSHLSALWSLPDQKYYMELFRHVYRANAIEPVLVVLMLTQIVTGAILLAGYSARISDFYRNLQVCTGAYLIFFISGHMNSVFVFARTYLKIPTDWNFATGAPTGLIADPWNIRLLPHYFLGVAFVLSHLALGLRVVLLAHQDAGSRREVLIDRMTLAGLIAAFVVSAAICTGMVGIHLGAA